MQLLQNFFPGTRWQVQFVFIDDEEPFIGERDSSPYLLQASSWVILWEIVQVFALFERVSYLRISPRESMLGQEHMRSLEMDENHPSIVLGLE